MLAEPIPRLTAALAGRYRVVRALRRGGMATVYLADDLRHRRRVAIKVLKPELTALLGRERFLREIELTAGLHHPHIVPLFDSGEADGLLYYVMPFIDGESLRDRLRRERQLPVDEAVAIVRQVASALTSALARGVVHRDIKPENILLTGGHALVADFGIARAIAETGGQGLTGADVTLGTPAYMSPEQATGDQAVDGRSDVYALGCVLYEMLTGEPPFTGPTAQAIIGKHLTEPVPEVGRQRMNVPHQVDAAITRALAKVRADRFPTAQRFAEALVTPVEAPPGTPAPPAPPATSPSRPGRRRLAVGAALLAALALVAAIALDTGGLRTRASRRLAGAPAAAVEGRRSIAVLPFVNVGANPDEEYFSDGLSEELIAALSQLRSLRVAARTSSFAFKGRPQDIRDVARSLDVGTVLVGSVRKAKNRIRVTAQLVDASSGLDLWSQTYDERDLADVFDIQADIARRIAAALETSLTPSEQRRLAARPTENIEAYTLYLKGRYFWSRRGAGLSTAIEYFNRAIAIDSQYARAYAGLAGVYGPLGVHGHIHPREGRERMREAARRALALDDELAEAHTVLAAYHHVYEWDWVAAEQEFRRAIELDPNYPTAHLWYGHFLENLGRFDEALVERRLAHALDPLAPTVGVASVLALAGRRDSAKAAYREAIEVDPGYWQAHEGLGNLLIVTGDIPGAVAAFRRAVASAGGTSRATAGLARALALAGKLEEARALVRAIREEAAMNGFQNPEVAPALLALGERDAAFDWLEAAFRQRHPNMTSINVYPAYAEFRADPRFRALVRRVGFPAGGRVQ